MARSARRSKKVSSSASGKIRMLKMTSKELSKKLAAQDKAEKIAREMRKERARLGRQVERARDAIKLFRPKKSELGKIVIVNTRGKRILKGKKGYPVYVTKTKKKWLVREHGKELRPRRIQNIELPVRKNLRKSIKEFKLRRRELSQKGYAILRGSGIQKSSTSVSFAKNSDVVEKLTNSIMSAMRQHVSHRDFDINCNVLVKLPDGRNKVYNFSVALARPDHIAIKRGGVKNFVLQKFYATMAKQLAFDGYVSLGSSNHIRRMKENRGAEQDELVDKNGEIWIGHDMEIVNILSIEWKIEQLK